jgi:hypothetical protein
MGIRSRIKGKIKSALGVADAGPEKAPAPSKHMESISQDTGEGNLRGDKDVPWYLKYDDADGWESTDANSDVDED